MTSSTFGTYGCCSGTLDPGIDMTIAAKPSCWLDPLNFVDTAVRVPVAPAATLSRVDRPALLNPWFTFCRTVAVPWDPVAPATVHTSCAFTSSPTIMHRSSPAVDVPPVSDMVTGDDLSVPDVSELMVEKVGVRVRPENAAMIMTVSFVLPDTKARDGAELPAPPVSWKNAIVWLSPGTITSEPILVHPVGPAQVTPRLSTEHMAQT